MLRSLLALSAFLPASLATAAVVVAPDGDDVAGDGSAGKPFATVSHAVASLPAAGDRRVLLRGGVHFLTSPLLLKGVENVVIEPEALGEVTLSAGRAVGPLVRLTDPAVLDRLRPEARERVRVADLTAAGVSDLGQMSGGFYIGGSTGVELFVNGKPTTLARYPNDGFIKIKQAIGPTKVDIRGTVGAKEGIFTVDEPRLAQWAKEPEPMVNGYWFWDWADQRQSIALIDPASGRVELAPPWHAFGYRDGQWFYVFNALSELDQPGEWTLDRAGKKAYLILPEGADESASIVATLLPNVVTLEDCTDVTIRGVTIEGARTDAVVIRGGAGVRIEGCTIRNGGQNAVVIDSGDRHTVAGCHLYGLGDGGVVVRGGDRATLTGGASRVEGNRIHDYARWNRTYHPGVSLDGVGHVVARNHIHDAPHQAIALQGNDMLIEHNLIERVCQETTDAGAIYGWNDPASRGHIIRRNLLRDITGLHEEGANGVYLDDNFAAAEVYENVFDNVDDGVLHGGGQESVYRDNVFIDCRIAIKIDARGLDWRVFGKDELVQKLQKWPYQQEPWASRYPSIVNMIDNDFMTPRGTVVKNNRAGGGKFLQLNENAKPYVTVEANQENVDRATLLGERQ